MAHSGKDRPPFPVPIRFYDQTIRVLKTAAQKAKLGRDEGLGALRRLDGQSRNLEETARGPGLARLVAGEFENSSNYGARSVFGTPIRQRTGSDFGHLFVVTNPSLERS
jgi:hypothetical protein